MHAMQRTFLQLMAQLPDLQCAVLAGEKQTPDLQIVVFRGCQQKLLQQIAGVWLPCRIHF